MRTRNAALITAVCFMTVCMSACGHPADAPEISPAEEPEASAETETALPDPFDYTFNPHVISEEYRTVYGEGIEEEFFAFCDADRKSVV